MDRLSRQPAVIRTHIESFLFDSADGSSECSRFDRSTKHRVQIADLAALSLVSQAFAKQAQSHTVQLSLNFPDSAQRQTVHVTVPYFCKPWCLFEHWSRGHAAHTLTRKQRSFLLCLRIHWRKMCRLHAAGIRPPYTDVETK